MRKMYLLLLTYDILKRCKNKFQFLCFVEKYGPGKIKRKFRLISVNILLQMQKNNKSIH